MNRSVNEGFSGGEKKRNEILQMAVLRAEAGASWTRPIPAWTSTRCASWPAASTPCASPERAFLVVTHYQRLLNYIVPDMVHVLVDGRIVKSGGKELALELEEKGYAAGSGRAAGNRLSERGRPHESARSREQPLTMVNGIDVKTS